jgi:DNA-binding MarR family transcriptional regulator
MIEAIHNYPQVNANELARILGVTNGAITQMANKLIKKGFVEMFRLNGNRKEVYYKLTSLGEVAYEGHEKYHAKIHGSFLRYLDELDEEKIETIINYFDKLIEVFHVIDRR